MLIINMYAVNKKLVNLDLQSVSIIRKTNA